MPPDENTKNNNSPLGTFRVGIDPVFKSNSNLQKPTSPTPGIGTTPTPSGAYNVLNNQEYLSSSAKASTPIQPLQSGDNSLKNKSIIRTFKGDMESVIQADHLSSINIAIAENEKMHSKINMEQKAASEELVPEVSSNYSKNKIIIFISIILILIGVAGIVVTFLIKGQNSNPAIWVQELPSLITTEYKNELNIDTVAKGKFVVTLSGKINDSPLPVNNFSNTYITTSTSTGKRLLNSGEFISLAGLKIPEIMKRTLLPDLMVGTYSLEKNLPFLILKTTSFENTYAGMLTWEKTMEKDVRILFKLPGYENSQGILDELTPTPVKSFVDKVIVNKDTRLVKSDAGQTILLYGIIDKETIVITVNEEAFKEIINRLNKEKTLKR